MATTQKPIITEASCPKCGTMVQRADQRKTIVGLLDKNVWQCPACGHPFNYPPLPHPAKRR